MTEVRDFYRLAKDHETITNKTVMIQKTILPDKKLWAKSLRSLQGSMLLSTLQCSEESGISLYKWRKVMSAKATLEEFEQVEDYLLSKWDDKQ